MSEVLHRDTEGNTRWSSVIDTVYPVGSIYISVNSTNPGTLFGVGTWSAFGTGRTLVGIDAGDADFDTVEETSGSKTHQLTTAQLPSHFHHIEEFGGGVFRAFAGRVAPASGGATDLVRFAGTEEQISTQSSGSDNAHNNVQPSIVVYMWKRTA